MDSINRIKSISIFDRQSIDYLISCLHDASLEVRYHAHHKLNSNNLNIKVLSNKEIETIAMGILIDPGDVVWSVYRSGLTYDDNDYYICAYPDDSGREIYGREIDPSHYDLWNRGVVCKLISTHIDRESAEIAANQVIKDILSQNEYPYSSGGYSTDWRAKISQQDIYNWVKIYDLPDLPEPPNPQPFDWIDLTTTKLNNMRLEEYQDELYRYSDCLRSYAVEILDKLTVDDHYEAIDRIYSNLFGRLAYVCKETVRATTYFTH